MINVNHVTLHYGTRPVLRDVTLHVRKGELVALMGPNGMGKSSLMGVMAGVLWPVKGSVDINGKRRRESEQEELAVRKEVLYLPAEPYLPRLSTARQWVLAVGRVYGIDDDRVMEHTERLLELFDLTKQADSTIASCSSGQKKKVALSGALVAETPVMLLDEPFSGGLDPSGILALKRVLRHRVDREGATVVMATPVPELVEELADRIAVLREGRLVAYDDVNGLHRLAGCDGKLDEVYERLANPQAVATIQKYFEGGRA
jgi:ABC-2 type transport system ATP-binding protein